MAAQPGIVRDPRLQIARFADIDDVALGIQHSIDAGRRRERLEIGRYDIRSGCGLLRIGCLGLLARRDLTCVLDGHEPNIGPLPFSVKRSSQALPSLLQLEQAVFATLWPFPLDQLTICSKSSVAEMFLRRMQALCIAAALTGLLLPLSTAQSRGGKTFKDTKAVLRFIEDYRTNKAPSRLPNAVQAMSRHGLFHDHEQGGLYIGFIAGVIGENQLQAEKLISRMFPMRPEEQVVLIKAIAYSGLPDWKQLMGKFVERMPARTVLIRRYLFDEAPTLEELPLDTAGSFALDTHWGYYFATGSYRPAQRIVAALAWSVDRNDVEKLTLGSMAKWTLANNAARDIQLLGFLKSELNHQPASIRPALRDVILAAETFEMSGIRKESIDAVAQLKTKGPQSKRDIAWWGQAGQTTLALGCVVAAALGQVEFGIPCVVGGALSSAALKYATTMP